jgi:hypothetical protein
MRVLSIFRPVPRTWSRPRSRRGRFVVLAGMSAVLFFVPAGVAGAMIARTRSLTPHGGTSGSRPP